MAILVAKALPSVTMEQIIWDMSYNMTSFLVMQSLKLAGVKGIGRIEESDEVWEKWINEKKDKIR